MRCQADSCVHTITIVEGWGGLRTLGICCLALVACQNMYIIRQSTRRKLTFSCVVEWRIWFLIVLRTALCQHKSPSTVVGVGTNQGHVHPGTLTRA